MRCVPLFPRGACPQMSWDWMRQDFLAEPSYWKWRSSDRHLLRRPRSGAPPSSCLLLRRATSGNAPFLDFSYEELYTAGADSASQPHLRTAREKSLKSRRLLLASWNLSTTVLTASPNRPEGKIGASSRKTLSLSLIWDKVNHKCLSVATRAAIDRPIALAVSLVARVINLWLYAIQRYHHSLYHLPHPSL